MNKAGFLFLGAVLSIAGTSAMLAGCGGDTTSGTGGGTSGTGGSTTATTGTGGSGGGTTTTTTTTTSTTSSTGTGMAPTLDCASYCTEVMANCTAGSTEQYTNMESCLKVCSAFPLGTLADTANNTLGCRLYHAGVAGTDAASAATHCAHAGITGGDKDVKDAMPAVCGEGCDAFCDVAQVICTGANEQYKTKELCLTDCKGFSANVESYSTADTAKNDFGCRAYHLTVAGTDAASATAHCGHITGASPVCTQ